MFKDFFSIRVTHRTAGEGRGPSFIPLYHFHPLTNIQTFICSFACEMTITYSNRTACIYQTATRWDLPPYRITIWLIDDVILIFVYLLVELILGFVTAIWHESDKSAKYEKLGKYWSYCTRNRAITNAYATMYIISAIWLVKKKAILGVL